MKTSADASEDLISLELEPGEMKTITFTPDADGRLYLYCKPHESVGMTGTITVTTP